MLVIDKNTTKAEHFPGHPKDKLKLPVEVSFEAYANYTVHISEDGMVIRKVKSKEE